jgi:hypothetical protein
MANEEEKNEKKITTEEAFHLVGETLAKLDARLDNHAEQLANHQETLTAAATLIDMLKTAVLDLQVRAGLKPAGAGPVN